MTETSQSLSSAHQLKCSICSRGLCPGLRLSWRKSSAVPSNGHCHPHTALQVGAEGVLAQPCSAPSLPAASPNQPVTATGNLGTLWETPAGTCQPPWSFSLPKFLALPSSLVTQTPAYAQLLHARVERCAGFPQKVRSLCLNSEYNSQN